MLINLKFIISFMRKIANIFHGDHFALCRCCFALHSIVLLSVSFV